jgi:hypothetical protein
MKHGTKLAQQEGYVAGLLPTLIRKSIRQESRAAITTARKQHAMFVCTLFELAVHRLPSSSVSKPLFGSLQFAQQQGAKAQPGHPVGRLGTTQAPRTSSQSNHRFMLLCLTTIEKLCICSLVPSPTSCRQIELAAQCLAQVAPITCPGKRPTSHVARIAVPPVSLEAE